MLKIQNLRFSYDPSSPLFDRFNLTVSRASSVCLVGPDGAGKTTLLKLIKGLMAPSSGHIVFCDSPIRSQDVAYLGGDPRDSFVGLTVEEEIVFGPENLGLPVDEIRNRLNQALALTLLDGYQNRLTHTLSGGEQQKLALASALVMDPQILLIDDAFSMMDPPSRAGHWAWIKKLTTELRLTVIFTTNKLAELRNSERVIFIDDASHELRFDGTPEQFVASDLSAVWLQLENGIDKLEAALPKDILEAFSIILKDGAGLRV